MSAVLQPTDTPSTVGTAERPDDEQKKDDAPKKKKKADPVEAAKRLAESRERMRQWMIDPDGRHEARRRRAVATGTPDGGPTLLDRLRDHPVVGVAAEMVNNWWTRHPLHPVASIAEGAVRDHVAPVVRRHPLAVVTGAFAVGALVVWFRPWRWLSGTARAAGSASQFALKLLGSMPVASLLAAFAAAAKSAHDESDQSDEARDERARAQEAAAVAAQEHDEALAPLAGMPDAPAYPQDSKTVH